MKCQNDRSWPNPLSGFAAPAASLSDANRRENMVGALYVLSGVALHFFVGLGAISSDENAEEKSAT